MTNIVELPKPQSDKKSELGDLDGVYIYIEQAANWIANGSIDQKISNGPARLFNLMDEQSTFVHDAYEYQRGRYWLAFDMLKNAIMRGKITAYGRYYDPEDEDDNGKAEALASRAQDVLSDGRTRKVTQEEAREGFIHLGGEDDNIAIGLHIYDLIAVNWRELIEVFGPLSLEFGSHHLGEDTLAKKPSSLAAQQFSMDNSRIGRPQKFNWEKLLQEVAILASINGLPKTQAELERWAAEKCQELFGHEPAMSSIRSKIAPVYERLRQKGQ